MNRELIPSMQATSMAEQVNSYHLDKEQDTIVTLIEQAATKGEFEVTVPFVSDTLRQKLTSNGYVVRDEEQREGNGTILSWKP